MSNKHFELYLKLEELASTSLAVHCQHSYQFAKSTQLVVNYRLSVTTRKSYIHDALPQIHCKKNWALNWKTKLWKIDLGLPSGMSTVHRSLPQGLLTFLMKDARNSSVKNTYVWLNNVIHGVYERKFKPFPILNGVIMSMKNVQTIRAYPL